MGTKICMNNLDLMDYVTLVLKPISRKILQQLDSNVQVYHLCNFSKDDVVQEKKVRKDGGEYVLVKCYGSANLATTFDRDQGRIIWNHSDEPRKVMVMGSSTVSDGLFVSLDDLMASKKPVISMTAGLTASTSDTNDED